MECKTLSKLKIVAAIPCFNSEPYIGGVVAKAREYVDEVVVVDDGSHDASSQIARAAGALVTSHRVTKGYGESIKSCFEEARKNDADILVILDSDGQHKPDEIPRLVAPVVRGEANLAIGSRFLGAPSNMPRYRRLGVAIITWLFNAGSEVKITDAQSGFRAYVREVLNAFPLTEKGMGISVEIIIKARAKGLTISEVPISCSYHDRSSTMNPILHGLGVALAVAKFRFKTVWDRMVAKSEQAQVQSEPLLETRPVGNISIVIAAHNAERTLRDCLKSATTLDWAGKVEVIVVNDGSTDNTFKISSSFSGVRIINISHGGAAHATNIGIKAAHHDVVVLLDADAILEKDWLRKIVPAFDDPTIAAVGGYAVTANSSIIGKIVGYDVESRLNKVSMDTDHLYTMNTAYRREILLEVGPLNEELLAGYDVDLSRRLRAAGYRLILRKDATCRHYWRDNLRDYLRQQYNYAYHRMELAHRFGKPYDQVTGLGMILQVPLTVALVLAACLGSLTSPLAPLLLLLLPFVHLPKTSNLLISKKDACVLLLPLLFTIRNLCWVWAAIDWGVRRVMRFRVSQPEPGPRLADTAIPGGRRRRG